MSTMVADPNSTLRGLRDQGEGKNHRIDHSKAFDCIFLENPFFNILFDIFKSFLRKFLLFQPLRSGSWRRVKRTRWSSRRPWTTPTSRPSGSPTISSSSSGAPLQEFNHLMNSFSIFLSLSFLTFSLSLHLPLDISFAYKCLQRKGKLAKCDFVSPNFTW